MDEKGILSIAEPETNDRFQFTNTLAANTLNQLFNYTFDFLSDMEAWLLKVAYIINLNAVETVATVTFDTVRVQVQQVRGNQVIGSFSDKTYTVGGTGSQNFSIADHFFKPVKLQTGDVLRFLVTAQIDTDGTGSGSISFDLTNDDTGSQLPGHPHIEVHLHPDASHGQIMYKARKI